MSVRLRDERRRLFWQTIRHTGVCGVVMSVLSAGGCAWLDQHRGSGIKDSENWSGELRAGKGDPDLKATGLSNKANQIERNLGIR